MYLNFKNTKIWETDVCYNKNVWGKCNPSLFSMGFLQMSFFSSELDSDMTILCV